ncbi:MAG: lytic transglycosylase domain-containing protein [Pseudomonadota bacterium]
MLLAANPGDAHPSSLASQSDRVRAAVAEASRRFGVPAAWIWRIIAVESAGDAAAVSRAGAMGLMQIMPATYNALRRRHGLGTDPFDIRDNIVAGTGYLRELHDRYGAFGMLAAYNAGPGRWEDHLASGRALPQETQRYLAQLAPAIVPGTIARRPLGGTVASASPSAAPIFVVRAAAKSHPADAAKDGDTDSTTQTAVRPAAVLSQLSGEADDLDQPRVGPARSLGGLPNALFVTPSSRTVSR